MSLKERPKKRDADLCEEICLHPEVIAEVRHQLPQNLAPLAKLFKLLGDETRTRLLYALSLRELCVCDLAAILGTSISNTSYHLRHLKTAHLVKYRKEGKMVLYTLDDQHVNTLLKEGMEHIEHTRNEHSS